MVQKENEAAEKIDEIDRLITAAHEKNSGNVACTVLSVMLSIAGIDEDEGKKRFHLLKKLIEEVENGKPHQRHIVLLMIRAMEVRGIIISENNTSLEPKIAKLFKTKTPDIAKDFNIKEKDQTFQVIDTMESIQEEMDHRIGLIAYLPSDVHQIAESRQKVMKAINSESTKNYFEPFGINAVIATVKNIMKKCDMLNDVSDAEYFSLIGKIKDDIRSAKEIQETRTNHLYSNYLKEFIDKVESAIRYLEQGSSDRFRADISPKIRGKNIATKKYPLYEEGREVRVEIPLYNHGPGKAVDTSIRVTSYDDVILFDEEFFLGDISAGAFNFSFESVVNKSASKADVLLEVSWRSYGDDEKKKKQYECTILSQEPRDDWGELHFEEPYSTEVARGEEFVGRVQKLASIVKRLARKRMQSCYISGQKRVGKTSLAIAAKEEAEERVSKFDLHFLFLEWGDYASPDPEKAVNALGDRLYRFFDSVSPDVSVPYPDFSGLPRFGWVVYLAADERHRPLRTDSGPARAVAGGRCSARS